MTKTSLTVAAAVGLLGAALACGRDMNNQATSTTQTTSADLPTPIGSSNAANPNAITSTAPPMSSAAANGGSEAINPMSGANGPLQGADRANSGTGGASVGDEPAFENREDRTVPATRDFTGMNGVGAPLLPAPKAHDRGAGAGSARHAGHDGGAWRGGHR